MKFLKPFFIGLSLTVILFFMDRFFWGTYVVYIPDPFVFLVFVPLLAGLVIGLMRQFKSS